MGVENGIEWSSTLGDGAGTLEGRVYWEPGHEGCLERLGSGKSGSECGGL